MTQILLIPSTMGGQILSVQSNNAIHLSATESALQDTVRNRLTIILSVDIILNNGYALHHSKNTRFREFYTTFGC